jgi:hypothetical protein
MGQVKLVILICIIIVFAPILITTMRGERTSRERKFTSWHTYPELLVRKFASWHTYPGKKICQLHNYPGKKICQLVHLSGATC